jgi:hypothetical protein
VVGKPSVIVRGGDSEDDSGELPLHRSSSLKRPALLFAACSMSLKAEWHATSEILSLDILSILFNLGSVRELSAIGNLPSEVGQGGQPSVGPAELVWSLANWLIGELVNLTKSSVRNGNNPASSDIRSVASALSEGAFVCTPSDDQALRIGHVLRIIRIGFIR